MIGDTLNHYRILDALAKGGMGEVYAAEDTRLHRRVALKTLPQNLGKDPERRKRFERETRAIAALSHPNIVTIYSIEEADGFHFYTMELVEGRTLTELIPKKGFPLSRFMDLAIPITDALSAAHQQGITHRDVKPDNVMVCGDGRVKVLDFGLAKLRGEEDQGLLSQTQMPTLDVTGEGRILGTLAYMSPEQAEGRQVDQRSDVFSLGVLLYEMATGQLPFQGETGASVMASILRDAPRSVSDLNQRLPRHLGRIIKICLAKDPFRRYQTAIDLRNELEELKREVDTGEVVAGGGAPASARRPRGLPRAAQLILAAIAGAAATAGLMLLAGRGPIDSPGGGGTAEPPRMTQSRLTSRPGVEAFPSLSPDGKTLAYADTSNGTWDIFIQRVGGSNPLNLTADHEGDDRQPAFSPDGEHIAFRSERDGGGIFVMGATGESVRRLTDFGYYPAWSPDGAFLALSTAEFQDPAGRSRMSEIWIVDVAGGERRLLVGEDAVQASWSPGGGRIAYWGIQPGGGQRDLWTIPSEGGDPDQVTSDPALDWNPVWSPDGRYLYYSSDRSGAMNLWRLPIDPVTGAVTGEPEGITAGVAQLCGFLSLSADASRIAYVVEERITRPQRIRFDPETGAVAGDPDWVLQGGESIRSVNPSPDGQWLALDSMGRQEDILVVRPDGSGLRRLTDDPHHDRLPRWSPQGDRIAFYSDRSGSYEVWTIRPDGSGLRQITDTPGYSSMYPVWSPDGARMTFQYFDEGEAFLIDAGSVAGEGTPSALGSRTPQGNALLLWDWSPDGERIAGTWRFPDGRVGGLGLYDVAGDEIGLIHAPGASPVWLSDSRRLLFTSGSSIRLLDVDAGGTSDVFSALPDRIVQSGLSLSADDRTVYFTRSRTESDIWLLSYDEAEDPLPLRM